MSIKHYALILNNRARWFAGRFPTRTKIELSEEQIATARAACWEGMTIPEIQVLIGCPSAHAVGKILSDIPKDKQLRRSAKNVSQ